MLDVLLAIDPGKQYYAWAYMSLTTGAVIDTGMLASPLAYITMPSSPLQFRAFASETWRLLHPKNDLCVRRVVVERYQNRGMMVGEVDELVNIMIGAVWAQTLFMTHAVMYWPETPVHWKNWLSTFCTGKVGKDDGLAKTPDAFGYPQVVKNERKREPFPIKEHQFDAIGIGFHHLCLDYHKPLAEHAQRALLARVTQSINALWAERMPLVKPPVRAIRRRRVSKSV